MSPPKQSAMGCIDDSQARLLAGERMRLRYGFNEIDSWWHFGVGEHRSEIRRRLKLMGTQVIRIFVFDKPVPDPVQEWPSFAAYVQAVLDADALPMITFAKYHPPHDDPRSLRAYVERSKDIVWGCLEQWGGERVRDWYWCIWNEPNNVPVGGGLSFQRYRAIYEVLAREIHALLAPHLDGRKARIGGPAVDGFQPYWLDWISGLVNEVDDALVGFVSWHKYGDWRPVVPSASIGFDLNGSPDAPEGSAYERLLMAQTPDYEARARAVARVIAGRDILNVCGELNTIVHHDHQFVGGQNQNTLGAAYYASALIYLLRGGADLEMRWTATDNDDAYGLITRWGGLTPTGRAKQLFATHVRFGDQISFPGHHAWLPEVDAVIATDGVHRLGGVFVHTSSKQCSLALAEWDAALARCPQVFKIDATTAGEIACEPCDGVLRLNGYAVAAVTSAGIGQDGGWQ